MSNNPCEPTTGTSHLNAEPNAVNWRRWAAFGFVVACIPIATIGAYGLYADAQYAATLPPNTPRCGNFAMAAMFLIFPISPMFGCLGAGIGIVSAIVCNAVPIGGSQKAEDVK